MSDTFTPQANTDLRVKVAVITGVESEVGLALALLAAEQGMKMALADGDRQRLAAALDQVKARNAEAIAVHCRRGLRRSEPA